MALIHADTQGKNGQPATKIQPVEVLFSEGTVAQLIRCVVEAQVRDLAVRRQWSAGAVRQALDSQYRASLPEAFMQQLLAWQKINVRQEVQAALTSFQEGIFAISVDGRELPRRLEESVRLMPHSRVTFRRIFPVMVA